MPLFIRAGAGLAIRRHRLLWAVFACLGALATSLGAAIPPGQICDQAAAIAAREQRVPLDVMQAITRTETGRAGKDGLKPWPWTVNMEGTGRWFTNREEARAYAYKHFDRGARSFDIGCFQINFKWHGEAFRSIDEMFDPVVNARYAARFLNELFAEFGDWTKAAGAYHSRSPQYARIYEARFSRIRANVAPPGEIEIARGRAVFGPPKSLDIHAGLASGPMFGHGATRMGSLVPQRNTGASPARHPFSILQD